MHPDPITRDFTVAVFVVRDGRVLLHRHRKLGLWLPPGGHIEPNELPDEAAVREVEEEAGLGIILLQDPDLPEDYPGQPRQLTRPVSIQLESITPGHEHIDLLYFATLAPGEHRKAMEGMHWFTMAELHAREDITEEILAWSERAIRAYAAAT